MIITNEPSARDITPDGIASARPALAAPPDHPLARSLDEIEQRTAADTDQAARLEERLDLLGRPAAEERQPIADRRIFGAGTGVLSRLHQKAGGELAVDDNQAPAPQAHAH